MIIPLKEIHHLREQMSYPVIMVSGGFDPLHIGHVRNIREARGLAGCGTLIVVVNGDGFLLRKKHFVVYNLRDRLEIMNSIDGVDIVTEWISEEQTVCGALRVIRPDIFAKGGDWTAKDDLPEKATCQDIGTVIKYGIGGHAPRHSTPIMKRVARVINGCERQLND